MGSNIQDSTLVFSSSQVLTGDAASTNSINFGAAGVLPGDFEVWLFFEGLASGETLQPKFQGSSDDGSSDAYADKLLLPAQSADPSEPLRIPLNGDIADEQYGQMYYDFGGTEDSLTSVTVTSYLVPAGAK